MLVAYLGAFQNDWHTECCIARGLEQEGHEVVRLHEPDWGARELATELIRLRPDLFLFAKGRVRAEWQPSCEDLRAVVMAARAYIRKVACWVFDLVAEEYSRERWTWAQNAAALCDVFFTTDGWAARRIANSYILRQGVDHEDVRPGSIVPDWKADVLFLGGAYGVRGAWWDMLVGELRRRGLTTLHINDGCRGPALNDLMASVKLCVGPPWPAYPSYYSNRIYVVAGHGGTYCGPFIEGMGEEGWLSGKNMLVYPDGYSLGKEAMLAEWISESVACPDRLKWIGDNGQRHCLESLRYVDRCRTMVDVLQRK